MTDPHEIAARRWCHIAVTGRAVASRVRRRRVVAHDESIIYNHRSPRRNNCKKLKLKIKQQIVIKQNIDNVRVLTTSVDTCKQNGIKEIREEEMRGERGTGSLKSNTSPTAFQFIPSKQSTFLASSCPALPCSEDSSQNLIIASSS